MKQFSIGHLLASVTLAACGSKILTFLNGDVGVRLRIERPAGMRAVFRWRRHYRRCNAFAGEPDYHGRSHRNYFAGNGTIDHEMLLWHHLSLIDSPSHLNQPKWHLQA